MFRPGDSTLPESMPPHEGAARLLKQARLSRPWYHPPLVSFVLHIFLASGLGGVAAPRTSPPIEGIPLGWGRCSIGVSVYWGSWEGCGCRSCWAIASMWRTDDMLDRESKYSQPVVNKSCMHSYSCSKDCHCNANHAPNADEEHSSLEAHHNMQILALLVLDDHRDHSF